MQKESSHDIWTNYFVTIKIEDDYKEKKYKNLRKTKQPNRIIRYEDLLFLEEVFPMIQLIESLCFDGRFYGAEWQEELDDWNEYMYWVVFEKQKFFKSLGVKYDN